MDIPSLEVLEHDLTVGDVDIVKRMQALFYARHYDTEDAVKILEKALVHESILLRHEVAYVMGQMRQPSALPILMRLLDNKDEHPMVRHEAGEAIAALGLVTSEAFDCLRRHCDDSDQAVRETVELALIGLERTAEKIRERKGSEAKKKDPSKGFFIFTASRRVEEDMVDSEGKIVKVGKSSFGTCDPAEGLEGKAAEVAELGATLRDESRSLWERYVAMFTLRNESSAAAAEELAAALDEKTSALLRHEICFVLGQMQLPVSVEKLCERLEDIHEFAMVRHEAALALGSVGADIWTAAGRLARRKAIQAL